MVHTLGIRSIRFVAAFILVAVAAFVSLGFTGTARAQDNASVDIVDFGFDASSITIEAGATVTWTNTGNAPHTVTADDGTFDSGNLDNGGTFSFTFDTPGTYTYHCEIHPNMTGEIVVTEAGGGTTGGDNGNTTGDSGNTTDGGGNTTLPTTGVGTTATHDTPVALLAFALVLAAAGLLATRRRSAR